MDPPAGSGSLLSPLGGCAATVHLGAAEGQGTISSASPPPRPDVQWHLSALLAVFWPLLWRHSCVRQVFVSVCLPRLGLTVKPGSSPASLSFLPSQFHCGGFCSTSCTTPSRSCRDQLSGGNTHTHMHILDLNLIAVDLSIKIFRLGTV